MHKTQRYMVVRKVLDGLNDTELLLANYTAFHSSRRLAKDVTIEKVNVGFASDEGCNDGCILD
jgi:hypothetical protein